MSAFWTVFLAKDTSETKGSLKLLGSLVSHLQQGLKKTNLSTGPILSYFSGWSSQSFPLYIAVYDNENTYYIWCKQVKEKNVKCISASFSLLVNMIWYSSLYTINHVNKSLYYNHCSIRQRFFHLGSNEYSRSEVVAMEWLVQEVLNFKCFLPTIYNFLW